MSRLDITNIFEVEAEVITWRNVGKRFAVGLARLDDNSFGVAVIDKTGNDAKLEYFGPDHLKIARAAYSDAIDLAQAQVDTAMRARTNNVEKITARLIANATTKPSLKLDIAELRKHFGLQVA